MTFLTLTTPCSSYSHHSQDHFISKESPSRYSNTVESTAHFFLRCHHYHHKRAKLLNSLEAIDTNLLKLSEEQLTKVLLYGFSQLDQNQNRNILNSSSDYIVELKRFESSLF